MKKIKKDDQVVVLTGRDKGKKGKVIQISKNKILVEGINICKKHLKANSKTEITGGIVEKIMSIDISNVSIADENGKVSRIGIKIENGKKFRYFKTTGSILAEE